MRGYENNLDASESPFYRDCWQDTLAAHHPPPELRGNLPFEGGGGGAAAARSGGSTWEYGSGGRGGRGSGSGSSSSSVTIHEAAAQAVLEFVSCFLPLLRAPSTAPSGVRRRGGGGGGSATSSSKGGITAAMGGRSAEERYWAAAAAAAAAARRDACRQRSLRGCGRPAAAGDARGGLSDVAGPAPDSLRQPVTSCRSAPASGLSLGRKKHQLKTELPDDVSSSSSSALSPAVAVAVAAVGGHENDKPVHFDVVCECAEPVERGAYLNKPSEAQDPRDQAVEGAAPRPQGRGQPQAGCRGPRREEGQRHDARRTRRPSPPRRQLRPFGGGGAGGFGRLGNGGDPAGVSGLGGLSGLSDLNKPATPDKLGSAMSQKACPTTWTPLRIALPAASSAASAAAATATAMAPAARVGCGAKIRSSRH